MSDDNQIPDDCEGICACGYPLVPVLNEMGVQIGVNHGPDSERDFHHMEFFAGMRVALPRSEASR